MLWIVAHESFSPGSEVATLSEKSFGFCIAPSLHAQRACSAAACQAGNIDTVGRHVGVA